jgi:hypothetical protein
MRRTRVRSESSNQEKGARCDMISCASISASFCSILEEPLFSCENTAFAEKGNNIFNAIYMPAAKCMLKYNDMHAVKRRGLNASFYCTNQCVREAHRNKK